MQTEVKSETSLDKIRSNPGRSKSTELTAGGTAKDMRGASQAPLPSVSQQRWECRNRYRTGLPRNPVVPVLALDGEPLMPTCASRARRWVEQNKATPFWLNGVWCIRLAFEPSGRNKQKVVVGIDPGSKREAFTVASKAHTYLNVLAEGRPENTRLIHCKPLQFRRRALHLQNPAKYGVRRSHGGTLSTGFKRGSLVKHPKHGLSTVGGTMGGRISLHRLCGKRLCQNAKPEDITLLKRTTLIFQPVRRNGIPPPAKSSGFPA